MILVLEFPGFSRWTDVWKKPQEFLRFFCDCTVFSECSFHTCVALASSLLLMCSRRIYNILFYFFSKILLNSFFHLCYCAFTFRLPEFMFFLDFLFQTQLQLFAGYLLTSKSLPDPAVLWCELFVFLSSLFFFFDRLYAFALSLQYKILK